MGNVPVDQLAPDGSVVTDVDTTLTEPEKDRLLMGALPGSTAQRVEGVRTVLFEDQVIFRAQVTHLGNPWPAFKKRIQIPKTWLVAEQAARAEGYGTRFVGVYHYRGVTVFVDFDPRTYIQRKANNSAAHVSTNDLYQAVVHGQFSRQDRNNNQLTSVREDAFAAYLRSGYELDPRLRVFQDFNRDFITGSELDAITALEQMNAADWADRFQAEWPGFYVEYRLDTFVRTRGYTDLVQFQKDKSSEGYDYDLRLCKLGRLSFFGDLKSSHVGATEAPGNDAAKIEQCLSEYGRFWYVIYEHETHHARDIGREATIEWNEARRSLGHEQRGTFDPLSYHRRLKWSVRYVSMRVLELNPANASTALGAFAQGRQPDGSARAPKVMINKSNIDNFLVYSWPSRNE